MWDRRELKARGKDAFQANYWRSVLAALVTAIVTGAGVAASSGRSVSGNENVSNALNGMSQQELLTLAAVILGAVAFVGCLSTLLNILVFNPVEVGCRRFFLVNSEESAELGELGFAFKNSFLNVVKVTFLQDVFLFLWGLLVIIPIIVILQFKFVAPYYFLISLVSSENGGASEMALRLLSLIMQYFVLLLCVLAFLIPSYIKRNYSYRLVPYILAEDPAMGAREAITLSRQLMDGHKWSTFVLDLSFLGWGILSALTAGLVGIFYSGPYVAATDAELYRAIRYKE